jgi:hypothetical protein
MADEIFSDNLLRAIAAQLHFLNGMTAVREMLWRVTMSAMNVIKTHDQARRDEIMRATLESAILAIPTAKRQAVLAEVLASIADRQEREALLARVHDLPLDELKRLLGGV